MSDYEFLVAVRPVLDYTARHALDSRKADHLTALVAEVDRRLDQELRHVFTLSRKGVAIDGQPIHMKERKPLSLVWAVLASHQYRHETGAIRVEWLFPGRRGAGSASNALRRAEGAARRVSAPLAEAIKGLGVSKGWFVVRDPRAARRIRCNLSVTLP